MSDLRTIPPSPRCPCVQSTIVGFYLDYFYSFPQLQGYQTQYTSSALEIHSFLVQFIEKRSS